MDILSIVDVSISVTSPGISKLGFGEPCVFFYGTAAIPAVNPISDLERVRRYSSSTALSDMIADGFDAGDPAYRAVATIIAQDPHPPTVKVARGSTAFTQDVELEVLTDAIGNTIAVTITKSGAGGATRTYSQAASGFGIGGAGGECDTLAAAMNADGSGWGVVGSGELTIAFAGNIVTLDTVSPANDGELWYFSSIANISLEDVTPLRGGGTGIAADLAVVAAVDADWYELVLADCFGALDLLAAAGWVAASTNKILGASTQDFEVVSAGTGVGADLSAADRTATSLTFSLHSMAQYPGGAAAGRFLPEAPGTEMRAYKSLGGVTPSTLSAAQIANAEASFTNLYTGIEAGGVEIVRGNLWKGWSCGAAESFIDTTRLIDATVFEVQSRVLSLLRVPSKLPYTDGSLASIKGALLAALRSFMPLGYIEGSAFVNMPRIADISDANKAARLLPGVSFGATLAGGIAKVVVSGSMTF